MPAETISQFCDLFRPFSTGGCFCFESIRRSLVVLFGPNWLNHLGTVGVDCEVVAVKCIPETDFCPVQVRPRPNLKRFCRIADCKIRLRRWFYKTSCAQNGKVA